MTLKIMTFNLRIDNTGDGINCFDGRKERVKETILGEMPDAVGFQEASDAMTEWLRGAISPIYTIVGTGREADRTGEGARIAYNSEKFELLSLDTRWMSETPDVPASHFSADQSTCPRVYTVIELIEKKTRKIFRMMNTHLDHQGELAQICGAVQMLQRIAADNSRLPCPNVITGDFNAYPDSPTVKTFSANFTDLTSEIAGTFHGFGKRHGYDGIKGESIVKIDYIFSDAKKAAPSYIVPDEPVEGIYISDHFAVCSLIEI